MGKHSSPRSQEEEKQVFIISERKSSASQGASNCPRVGEAIAERKARASSHNGGCVQVAERKAEASVGDGASVLAGETDSYVSVRDDTPGLNPEGTVVLVPKDAWRAFLAGVRNGEFDLDGDGHLPAIEGTPA